MVDHTVVLLARILPPGWLNCSKRQARPGLVSKDDIGDKTDAANPVRSDSETARIICRGGYPDADTTGVLASSDQAGHIEFEFPACDDSRPNSRCPSYADARKIRHIPKLVFSGTRSRPQTGKADHMNQNTEISKKTAEGQLSPENNSESPARWVIHCICCEDPVEPWQTSGYQFGYCAHCFDVLMEPAGTS